MNSFMPFILVGLASGSAYALVALGVVVTYKTTGIFNFAQGSVAMVAAYVYYTLTVTLHLPVAAAIAIVVLVVAPVIGALFNNVLLRAIGPTSEASQIVATLGITLALAGLANIIYGASQLQVAQYLPTSTFELGGVRVGWDQLIIVCVALGSACGLAMFYRFTRLGLRTRALVDNEELTELEGVSARTLRTVSWMTGCAFAAIAGVLLVPLVGLDSTTLTLLVVQGFGAAAVGRLTSLPIAYLAALGISIVASLLGNWTAQSPSLAGLAPSLPFIVLFLVLVLSRSRRLSQGGGKMVPDVRLVLPWTKQRAGRWAIFIVAVLLLPLVLNGYLLVGATDTVIFVLVFASLYLLVAVSRQVSLCHAVFVGVGAVAVTKFESAHIPYVGAVVLAALIVVPIAACVALPAVRLSGLYLALATFGFGLLVQNLFFPMNIAFGSLGLLSMNRPQVLAGNRAMYWYAVILVGCAVAFVWWLSGSRLGRLARGVAGSEAATASLGVRPALVRVLMFCISASLAALAGALYVTLYGAITPDVFSYDVSLLWLAVLVTVGYRTIVGPIFAAITLAMIPTVFTWYWIQEWQGVFFGANALIYAQLPGGMLKGMEGQGRFVTNLARRMRRPASLQVALGPQETSSQERSMNVP
jgi:branched-subunit amino acid ABC-type transport system permease component